MQTVTERAMNWKYWVAPTLKTQDTTLMRQRTTAAAWWQDVRTRQHATLTRQPITSMRHSVITLLALDVRMLKRAITMQQRPWTTVRVSTRN